MYLLKLIIILAIVVFVIQVLQGTLLWNILIFIIAIAIIVDLSGFFIRAHVFGWVILEVIVLILLNQAYKIKNSVLRGFTKVFLIIIAMALSIVIIVGTLAALL